MRPLAWFLLLCFVPALPAAAADWDPPKKALFAQDRLWIMTASGEIHSIGEHSRESRHEEIGGRALDICAHRGRILAVVVGKSGDRTWTLRGRSRAGWSMLAQVHAEDEALLGLGCGNQGLLLLTTRRLVDLDNDSRSLALAQRLRSPYIGSILYATPAFLYLGMNSGEWGGGLRRIDRASGQVIVIEEPDSDCRDLLDSGCAPVHGIEIIPWKPDCLAVAAGLVHFMPDGGIAEVCGLQVGLFYSKPTESGFEEEGQPPSGSMAFFGLVRKEDELWAAGLDALYRFRDRGGVDMTPMPRFRSIDGFHVSFAVPGMVLLATDVNKRASVSNGAPMLVAR
jgi:hypothetical protein